MFQKLGRWPGIITKKTKQLLEKDFSIVQNGLDEKEVIPLVDTLSAQPDNSEPVPAESFRLLIDRMITDVGQIAADIKIKAEVEAQEEAVKIIDQAKQGAADIRKSVEVAAGKEAEEVLSALKSKKDITEEDARKKAQLYLLRARQEIETEVREEYRRTHSKLLYSLLSTSNDGAVSANPPPPLASVKEPEEIAGGGAKKTAWGEEKARTEEIKKTEAARKQAEDEVKKAAKAEEKARAEETKKAEAARKQAEDEVKKVAKAEKKASAEEANIALRESKHPEKEARRAVLTGAKDTTSSDGNIAQKETPAASETEPAAREASPGEIPSQATEDGKRSDSSQPAAPVGMLNDSSPPDSGETGGDEDLEQADTPEKGASAPVQSTEQVNETVVEKPAVEERENQPEDVESLTEKQAAEQTTGEPTLIEPDEPVLAKTAEGPPQPESIEMTLEQMVAKVARAGSDESLASSGDKAVTQSTPKQPPVDEPEVEKHLAEPPPLDTKAVYTGEIELAISVPVDPVAVSKLYNQLQSTPDMKILYTRGSWDRGTTITVSLEKPLPLIGIISNISGIAITPVNAEKNNITKSSSLLGATRQGVTRINLSIKEI